MSDALTDTEFQQSAETDKEADTAFFICQSGRV